MKIKRKFYPNSNDKEFILMSISDLKRFANHIRFYSDEFYSDLNDGQETGIKSFLKDFALKTSASHQKTKKQKIEQNMNA
jgi:hypothetical protein